MFIAPVAFRPMGTDVASNAPPGPRRVLLSSTVKIDRDFHPPSVLLARNNGTAVHAGKTRMCGFVFDRRDQPLQEQLHATFRGR